MSRHLAFRDDFGHTEKQPRTQVPGMTIPLEILLGMLRGASCRVAPDINQKTELLPMPRVWSSTREVKICERRCFRLRLKILFGRDRKTFIFEQRKYLHVKELVWVSLHGLLAQGLKSSPLASEFFLHDFVSLAPYERFK